MKKLVSVLLALCLLTTAFGLLSSVAAEGELSFTTDTPYVSMDEYGFFSIKVKIENAVGNLTGDAWIGMYPAGATQEEIETKAASMGTWNYVTADRRDEDLVVPQPGDEIPDTVEITVTDEWVDEDSGNKPQDGGSYELVLFWSDTQEGGYKIMARLPFTFGEAPADTDAPVAPPTADFTAAVAAVALLAVGVTVVVSKKKH